MSAHCWSCGKRIVGHYSFCANCAAELERQDLEHEASEVDEPDYEPVPDCRCGADSSRGIEHTRWCENQEDEYEAPWPDEVEDYA